MGKYKTKYLSRRKKNKSLNKKRENLRGRLKKLFFRLTLITFIAVIFWSLFFSGFLKIKEISLVTNSISKELIVKLVEKTLEGKYWGIIDRNNLFLVDFLSLSEKIKQKDPLIKEVKIEKKFPDNLKIEIKERRTSFLGCFNDDCFLIDEQGEAFAHLEEEAVKEKKRLILIRQEGELKKQVKKGDIVFNKTQLTAGKELSRLVEKEADLEIKREFLIPAQTINEIRAVTEKGWKIYFSLEYPLETQMKILKKVLKEEGLKGREGKLQYVDLRIRGRAIYKLQGEEKKEKSKTKEKTEENKTDSKNKKDEKE